MMNCEPVYDDQPANQYPDQDQDQEHDQDQPARRRCRHIFTGGRRCGSPCLRSEPFCYHHHTTRKPVADPKQRIRRASLYDLPDPEDRDAIRAAVAQIMHAIAQNAIDLKRAGMVLYSLQIALCALPPQPRPAPLPRRSDDTNPNPANDFVEDVVLDDTHGVIAPEADCDEDDYAEPAPRRSLARRLLDEVERYEARHNLNPRTGQPDAPQPDALWQESQRQDSAVPDILASLDAAALPDRSTRPCRRPSNPPKPRRVPHPSQPHRDGWERKPLNPTVLVPTHNYPLPTHNFLNAANTLAPHTPPSPASCAPPTSPG